MRRWFQVNAEVCRSCRSAFASQALHPDLFTFSEQPVGHQVGGTVPLLGQRCRASKSGFGVQVLRLQGVLGFRCRSSRCQKSMKHSQLPFAGGGVGAAVDIEWSEGVKIEEASGGGARVGLTFLCEHLPHVTGSS